MKNHLYIIILTVLVVTFIFVVYTNSENNSTFLYNDDAKKDASELVSTDDETTNSDGENKNSKILVVYITGCVNNPGVYEVPDNSRIIDVLKLAGGSSEKADLESINLAEYVFDAEHIIIPSIEDKIDKIGNIVQNSSIEVKININTSSKDELMKLRGIGEVMSSDIIDYRTKNGKFESIEDIKNVSGIGDKTFEKIKDDICVN